MNVNDVHGPYKDGSNYKLSKLVAKKMISDSTKVRHILIPFVGVVRADPSVTATEAEAKTQADSIYNVLKSNRLLGLTLLIVLHKLRLYPQLILK